MTAHVYTAPWQPATRYRVPGIAHLFKESPHRLVFAQCCRKKRRVRNVELQVFYDLTHSRCVTGKGCRQIARRAAGSRSLNAPGGGDPQ